MNILFEGKLPEYEEPALWLLLLRFLTTTRPWAHSSENRSFHNSISRNNIRRELIRVLEWKRMVVLSFGACAVVVAATA